MIATLTNFFISFFPYGFIKIMVLTIVAIYLVFASVIVRQEHLMSHVVEIPSSTLLRFISILHLLAVITAFFLALLLL